MEGWLDDQDPLVHYCVRPDDGKDKQKLSPKALDIENYDRQPACRMGPGCGGLDKKMKRILSFFFISY